jgi:hypothetical protein
MENSAGLVGRLVGALLFALPAVYFLVRGLLGGPRSRRFANLALFCGLTAFVMPEMALGLSPAEWPGLFLASGVVRVLAALAGLALAVAALVTRRDGGVGVARPLTGAGFSLLHLLAGGGLLLFGALAQPSTPWVYQAPDGAYRLTLPSRRWKESPTTGGGHVVAFVSPLVPRMQAAVLTVRRQQTEADFARAAEASRTRVENNPQLRGQAKFREGTNAAGHRYHYWAGMDSSPDGKPVFVAYSVTWCPDKQMVIDVLFEGLPTMLSRAGKVAEMGAIEQAAETICLSVE